MMTKPDNLIFIDCQTSAATPAKGQMIELAWARGMDDCTSSLIAMADEETLPRRIAKLTGIEPTELENAPSLDEVLRQFRLALSDHVVLIAHFARFERPFLTAALGTDLPCQLICTHAIAQRLLPDLPSKGLKALAGFFGHSITEVKRAADHVEATRIVWLGMQQLLLDQGVQSIAALMDWLDSTPVPKRTKMQYQIAKDIRLSLPQKPGVYRFKNKAGQTLYVGKATNLKQRVNSYFRSKRAIGPRHSEFLTQAVELDITTTATDVEAALLETDEIKRINPPYNVALKTHTRKIAYFDLELKSTQPFPDERHVLGPFTSEYAFEWLEGLQLALDGSEPANLNLWQDEDAAVISAGLRILAAEINWQRGDSVRRLFARGLWALRERLREQQQEDPAQESIEAASTDDDSEVLEGDDDVPMTPEEFAAHCVSICRHAARAYLRARSLNALLDCELTWKMRESKKSWRTLVLRDGAVTSAQTYTCPSAVPPRHYDRSSPAEITDLLTYDRLRTLRTEIKRLRESQPETTFVSSPSPIMYLRV